MLLGCKSIAIVFPFQSLCFSSLCLLSSSCFEIEKDAHLSYFFYWPLFFPFSIELEDSCWGKENYFYCSVEIKTHQKRKSVPLPSISFHYILIYFSLFSFLTSTTGCKDLITSSNSFRGVLTPRRLLTVEKWLNLSSLLLYQLNFKLCVVRFNSFWILNA